MTDLVEKKTALKIAKALVNRLLHTDVVGAPPEFVSAVEIAYEDEWQITYKYTYTTDYDKKKSCSFSVYTRGSIDHPVIVINDDYDLHIMEFYCASADENFFEAGPANKFLDAFYSFWTPFFDSDSTRGARQARKRRLASQSQPNT